MKELKQEKRGFVLGDADRADSPGHSAKFGSYTMMELKKRIVLDLQLVQVSSEYVYHTTSYYICSVIIIEQ